MSMRTVKVSNISKATSERDIEEFFSFSGEILYVEMQRLVILFYVLIYLKKKKHVEEFDFVCRETENTQVAYVTYKDSQGADTAILLTGAKIGDLSVTIALVENYHLPPEAMSSILDKRQTVTGNAPNQAEDVVSTMLAKGFILGKDAVNKAKAFDERHQLTSNASATVTSIDRKMGITEKITAGTAVVNEKVREMDEKFQVSEKTKSALAVAEQKASSAGTALMSNYYVFTGAAWFSNAVTAVTKAAEEVTQMTKAKVEKAEEEKKESIYRERTGIINNFAELHLDEPLPGEPAIVPVNSADR
ncbi:binding partner of ACD11 1-like isoform X2 [Cucurbita moschata]|uniref:Binding partner of ACD11 1-like isoform X2 n=1 Tax=Cucurbita moschata TaxID=3662 RepID=A0A6J1FMX0_CUCMO|nr:binding partner of ACD11 1-like isoform X2 [Cucurbita moschata]